MAAGSWAGWFSETAQAASTWSCWAPSRGVAEVGYQRCNCMVCLGEQNRSRHCVGGGSLGTGPPTWRQICALVLSFLVSWSSLESATRQDVDFETCCTFTPFFTAGSSGHQPHLSMSFHTLICVPRDAVYHPRVSSAYCCRDASRRRVAHDFGCRRSARPSV